ncbi:MAG: hypothetical protein ACOC92_01120 [bacterium]
MATAGYSGTPLARKLGLRKGMRVRLIAPPDGYWTLLDPDGERGDPGATYRLDTEPADFQHLFATERAALEQAFEEARRAMAPDGMVWASWPKKASGISAEIGRAEVMAAGKAVGLVDVKVCAVDETWSGLKFVIPVARR